MQKDTDHIDYEATDLFHLVFKTCDLLDILTGDTLGSFDSFGKSWLGSLELFVGNGFLFTDELGVGLTLGGNFGDFGTSFVGSGRFLSDDLHRFVDLLDDLVKFNLLFGEFFAHLGDGFLSFGDLGETDGEVLLVGIEKLIFLNVEILVETDKGEIGLWSNEN